MKLLGVLKKSIAILFIIVVFVFIFYDNVSFNTYSRYTSVSENDNEVRVAKYGKLTLVEKLDGVIQSNDSDTIDIVEKIFVPGQDIKKEVYFDFTYSEVSMYFFLVVEVNNWQYDSSLNEFYLINNGCKLLSFNVMDGWHYLENLGLDNKFVFYYDYNVNFSDITKVDVINQINTGVISSEDINVLSSGQVYFSAYSIQKNDDLDVLEAWNYLNI